MFADIWGKKIWYEVYGPEHGETLLYLHGGPGASCLDFAGQARALSGRIRVVTLDQLGVLRSEGIAEGERYSMAYQIGMLEELRNLLGIQRWSVLGHSYGGMLAVLYADTCPEAVRKLLLECPSLWFEDSARSTAACLSEHIRGLHDREAMDLCEKLQRGGYEDPADAVWDLSSLLGYVTDMELRFYLHGISFEEYETCLDASGITDEMWAKGERHLKKLLEAPPDGARMTDNLLPMIQKISAPVLLMNGRYDPACTGNQIDFILSHGRNVTQVMFEHSGHFPRLEEPEQYTNAVLSFLGS